MTITTSDLPREHRASRAVNVANLSNKRGPFSPLKRGPSEFHQAMIKRALEPVVLGGNNPSRHIVRNPGLIEDPGEIEPSSLPVIDPRAHVEQITAANQVIQVPYPKLRHQLTHFFGNKEKVVHDMLGLALKLGAQYRILCGNPDRTGVQMAFTHHDAALDHQRRGRKTELVRP